MTINAPQVDSSHIVGKTVQLKDGRRPGYAVFGDQDGSPIVYCAGGVGSRLQGQPTPGNPLPRGIRVIGVDRPGLGLSDFLAGRRILDWPSDLAQLADALGLETFSVLGVSAGGPYALACAHSIPDRLNKCGLVASATPPDLDDTSRGLMSTVLWVYWRMPWLTRILFWWQYPRHAGKSRDELDAMARKPVRISRMFCESDRQLWSDPEVRRHGMHDHLEAFRQGTKGPALGIPA